MRNICPYTCKDSKFNRTGVQTSYVKFICKLHTPKRGCCKSNFTIIIKDNIVQSIELDNIMHNHSMDKLFIESKVTLLTSQQKDEISRLTKIGLQAGQIRNNFDINLQPSQLYNERRTKLKERFSDEIQNLYDFTQKIKKNYEIIWKNDENNKFYSLLIVNTRIKNCSYSNDLIIFDDTLCTNRFQYPILPFFVFDENNKRQTLAISIITGKDEIHFVDILQSLKEIIIKARVFVIDRLQAQINAIKKVFNDSNIIFCRIHIARNIQKRSGRNTKILKYFYQFINMEIGRERYIEKIQKHIVKSKENSSSKSDK